MMKSKGNNITRFDESMKEAKEIISQRKNTDRIWARERYKNEMRGEPRRKYC